MRGGKETASHVPSHERLRSMFALIGAGVVSWIVAIWLGDYGSRHLQPLQEVLTAQTQARGSTVEFLFSVAFAAVLLIFLRKHRAFGVFAAVTLAFLGFSGVSLVAGTEAGFFVSVCVLLFERLRRSYLSNDALILFAAAFGSLPVALAYPVDVLAVFLVLISVYDVLGVLVTGFIPRLAKEAVTLEVPLLLLAPRQGIAWQSATKLTNTAAMLGAGDVFIPALFICAVAFHSSPFVAATVLLGAMVGGCANVAFAALVRGGIPAMPLLTAGMLIGYALVR